MRSISAVAAIGALALLFFSIQGCNEKKAFPINIQHTCEAWEERADSNRVCSSWRTTGEVVEERRDGGGCFPGDAVVLTPRGPKRLAEVAVGEELLGQDARGKPVYSPVRAWLHRDTDLTPEMVRVTTGAGGVTVSTEHYFRTAEGHAIAGDLLPGQKLFTPAGDVFVHDVERGVNGVGAFAPLTRTSNYFVGASNASLVLAHAFAHFPPSRVAEFFVHSVLSVGDLIMPEMKSVREDAYIHPIALLLARFAGIDLITSEDVKYRRLQQEGSETRWSSVLS